MKEKMKEILKRKLVYLEEAVDGETMTRFEQSQLTIEYLSVRRVLGSLYLCEDVPEASHHERLQWFYKALSIGEFQRDKEIKSFLEEGIKSMEEDILNNREYSYKKRELPHKRKLRIPDES